MFWITVGEHGDLVALQIALQIALLDKLDAAAPDLRSIYEGAERLRTALATRRCLVVVDDVWMTAAAHAFRPVTIKPLPVEPRAAGVGCRVSPSKTSGGLSDPAHGTRRAT